MGNLLYTNIHYSNIDIDFHSELIIAMIDRMYPSTTSLRITQVTEYMLIKLL